MNHFRTRLLLKARLRQVRCNQPSRSSEEAYAQMERMRASANEKFPKTIGVYSMDERGDGDSPGTKDNGHTA